MTKTEITDYHDPERLKTVRWAGAYKKWLEHDTQPLADLIMDKSFQPFPDDLLEFLADLVQNPSGMRKEKNGRPKERKPWDERRLVREVFQERLNTTKDKAISIVAERNNMSEGTLAGIYKSIHNKGVTFEWWKSIGCPVWEAD